MQRRVKLIVIHCSASKSGVALMRGDARERTLRTAAEVIDAWHAERGFERAERWRNVLNPRLGAIGYHFVIDTAGAIESGRHLDEIGAHTSGHNAFSIGVCMVGIGQYTEAQWAALKVLVESLTLKYPGATVTGHRDLSPDLNRDGVIERQEWLKTCPEFDVAAWRARGMAPAPDNVFATEASA